LTDRFARVAAEDTDLGATESELALSRTGCRIGRLASLSDKVVVLLESQFGPSVTGTHQGCLVGGIRDRDQNEFMFATK
jgi:hypothetical protein